MTTHFEETTPTEADVLCGTGYEAIHHAGNLKFKLIVAKHFDAYDRATTKKSKMTVSKTILAEVFAGGARFLKKDTTNHFWYTADLKVGKDKISHSLRDLKRAKGAGAFTSSSEILNDMTKQLEAGKQEKQASSIANDLIHSQIPTSMPRTAAAMQNLAQEDPAGQQLLRAQHPQIRPGQLFISGQATPQLQPLNPANMMQPASGSRRLPAIVENQPGPGPQEQQRATANILQLMYSHHRASMPRTALTEVSTNTPDGQQQLLSARLPLVVHSGHLHLPGTTIQQLQQFNGNLTHTNAGGLSMPRLQASWSTSNRSANSGQPYTVLPQMPNDVSDSFEVARSSVSSGPVDGNLRQSPTTATAKSEQPQGQVQEQQQKKQQHDEQQQQQQQQQKPQQHQQQQQQQWTLSPTQAPHIQLLLPRASSIPADFHNVEHLNTSLHSQERHAMSFWDSGRQHGELGSHGVSSSNESEHGGSDSCNVDLVSRKRPSSRVSPRTSLDGSLPNSPRRSYFKRGISPMSPGDWMRTVFLSANGEESGSSSSGDGRKRLRTGFPSTNEDNSGGSSPSYKQIKNEFFSTSEESGSS